MNRLTVYVSIGNSDDKLTQARWSLFVSEAGSAVARHAAAVHGSWRSPSDDPWQNACWCIEINTDKVHHLQYLLGEIARQFEQDSIAWAVAETEFIPGDSHD